MGENGLNGAMRHAHEIGQPKPKAQVVVTLFDNNTTNLQYTCDELTARGLLDKARSILDMQAMKAMAEQASRIVPPDRLIG